MRYVDTETRALRQKSRDLEGRYRKANTVQSTLETIIGSPTGNVLFEINQLKEKIAKVTCKMRERAPFMCV